jgi:cytochrome c-type biogenesis protein
VNSVTELAISGPLLLAAGVALLAGTISFASPCVVPLVPGYLAYLAALVGADAPAVSADEERKNGRWAVVGAALLFVLGFTVVFVATMGTLVWLAATLTLNQDLLQRIGGVLTIAMALVFLGWIPGLQREVRSHHVPRGGVWGAPLLGAIFGLDRRLLPRPRAAVPAHRARRPLGRARHRLGAPARAPGADLRRRAAPDRRRPAGHRRVGRSDGVAPQ